MINLEILEKSIIIYCNLYLIYFEELHKKLIKYKDAFY